MAVGASNSPPKRISRETKEARTITQDELQDEWLRPYPSDLKEIKSARSSMDKPVLSSSLSSH